MKYYIGVDLGTSAVKLLLMDQEGQVVNIVSREYPLSFPHPGWSVKEFQKDKNGNVKKAVIVSLEPKKDEKSGRMMMVPVEGSEKVIDAQLVLIAAGFLGSQKYVTDAFKIDLNPRTNVLTKPDEYETSVPGVFTAGDMHRGQSLVVWAIREGREAAKAVDRSLMGYTNL